MNEIQLAIDVLLKHYGSYRLVEDAIDVNYAYLWRLHKGVKSNPTDEVCRKLGIVKQVTYSSKGNGRARK